MKRDKILYLLLLRLAKDEFIAMAGHEFSEEEQKYLDILVRLKYIMSYIITSETPNYIGYLIEERGWRFINHYETLYFQKKQSKILIYKILYFKFINEKSLATSSQNKHYSLPRHIVRSLV